MTNFHQPVDAAEVPRFAGHSTFMRLPAVASAAGLDIALVGIPWDGGTTNRAGARHGPREVRNQSSLMRRAHHVSGIAPFSVANVADVGDLSVNPINLMDGLTRIEAGMAAIVAAGALPLSCGGDHLTTLPVLRAVAKTGPVGMIHFDAHSDTNDTYFGDNPYTHGTPFRRAIEEGLLDGKRVVQIGIRGSSEYLWEFSKDAGMTVIHAEEISQLGVPEIVRMARAVVGDGPTYLSFDVDGLDPAFAPGTGTPEIGGLTTREALGIFHGLQGLNICGGDVVEVSPQYDPSSNTAQVGAQMLFEILSLMVGSPSLRP